MMSDFNPLVDKLPEAEMQRIDRLFSGGKVAPVTTPTPPVQDDDALVEAMASGIVDALQRYDYYPGPLGRHESDVHRFLAGLLPHVSAEYENPDFRDVARALLPLVAQVRADADRAATERAAKVGFEYVDCGGPDVCKVLQLKDGKCLKAMSSECGRENAETIAAAIRGPAQ